MGCASVKKQDTQPYTTVIHSTGLLRITLTSGVFSRQAGLFKMDPYVILKLSNQQQQSKVIINGGKKPIFAQSFNFIINSNSSKFGRTLQMTLMDKCKLGSDNFVAHGTVDINPIINQKRIKQDFRCILNYQYKQIGFISVIAQFLQQQCQLLHFRFQQIFFNKYNSFGAVRCSVQVTIGQQILKTSKYKYNKNKTPMWIAEALSFKVFPSIRQCKIRILDDDNQICLITLPMSKLINTDIQQTFLQKFGCKTAGEGGILKFQTIKGKYPSFTFKNINSKSLQQLVQTNQTKASSQGYFSAKMPNQQKLNPCPYIDYNYK